MRCPDDELDRLAALGFDWIWLLGVWRTGDFRARSIATTPRRWRPIVGFCPTFRTRTWSVPCSRLRIIWSPTVSAATRRSRCCGNVCTRGVRLMLDFVPNHTARSSLGVEPSGVLYRRHRGRPRGEPKNFGRAADGRVFAFGRDPYFPGWSDTFQLNYRDPRLRTAMADELARAARACDGLRCDMAMLCLPEVFLSTWGDRAADRWHLARRYGVLAGRDRANARGRSGAIPARRGLLGPGRLVAGRGIRLRLRQEPVRSPPRATPRRYAPI